MGFVLSFIRCIKLAKNAEPPPLKRSKFLALGQQAFIHYFGWCLKNTLRPLFSHVPVAASDLSSDVPCHCEFGAHLEVRTPFCSHGRRNGWESECLMTAKPFATQRGGIPLFVGRWGHAIAKCGDAPRPISAPSPARSTATRPSRDITTVIPGTS